MSNHTLVLTPFLKYLRMELFALPSVQSLILTISGDFSLSGRHLAPIMGGSAICPLIGERGKD
jgi:hypothetical protein